MFRTKSIDELIAASADPSVRLRRSLGLWSLVALGIGSVIGSGQAVAEVVPSSADIGKVCDGDGNAST